MRFPQPITTLGFLRRFVSVQAAPLRRARQMPISRVNNQSCRSCQISGSPTTLPRSCSRDSDNQRRLCVFARSNSISACLSLPCPFFQESGVETIAPVWRRFSASALFCTAAFEAHGGIVLAVTNHSARAVLALSKGAVARFKYNHTRT